MRRRDIMKRAGRNLSQAKGRTILTSLAIAVGAFTLTMALAAGQGTRDYADRLLQNNVDPQRMFIVKDKSFMSQGGSVGLREYDPDVGESIGRPGTSMKMLNSQDITKLENNKDLTQVVPSYQLAPKWTTFEGTVDKDGVEKKYFATLSMYDASLLSSTLAGELPPLGEQIGQNDITIPEQYLEKLGGNAESLIGKKVNITFAKQNNATASSEALQAAFMQGGSQAVQDLMKPEEKVYTFNIAAIVKKNEMSAESSPLMYISPVAAKEIDQFVRGNTEDAGKFSAVLALATEGKDPEEVKKSLETEGYYANTAKDAQQLIFTIVNVLQGIVIGFGILALIASVFGIINTQYISVLERTSQIGLMKALGMPRSAVAKLFRYEAAWIGLLGGVLGAGLAFVVGTAANPAISEALGIGNERILVFVWWQIVALLVLLMVVAIIAGWHPARKAARLDPIEALRTE